MVPEEAARANDDGASDTTAFLASPEARARQLGRTARDTSENITSVLGLYYTLSSNGSMPWVMGLRKRPSSFRWWSGVWA